MNIPAGRRYLYFIIVGISITALLIYISDHVHLAKIEQYHPGNVKAFEEGRVLSHKYCSRCHLYPDPSLLPKKTWTSSVLPAMGPLLGIFKHKFETYPTETDPHLPPNYYPSKPQLSSIEWQKIIDYYEQSAPEEFKVRKKKKNILNNKFGFTTHTPEYRTKKTPKITAAQFDTHNQLIYAADANSKKILIFNNNLELINSFASPTPISDIHIKKRHISKPGIEELLLTFIGRLLPTDAPTGSVRKMSLDPLRTKIASDSLLFENLARPVESKWADLNQDGYDDLLISEFGHRTGRLFWVENTGEKYATQKNVLIDTPGCIQTDIEDFNKNNLKDIFALCTQTDQAIYLFVNQGEGNFLKKRLLQFQITAGSSSFSTHDFNGDGHLDILYTSGDNADYSAIFKPYHGVYIYINDGENSFTKEWFYPINGAYDAQARDFNNDGRLDIAVIAFYADYKNYPKEGFVLFKNEGELNFTPYHHPEASAGRWITMNIADWNDDGDQDILLGNFAEGSFSTPDSLQAQWQAAPHLLLLENQHN